MKPKELDCKITEILMCMYNSGDTTNCLADIKKLILEAEMKKGLEDFKICREEIEKARTELLEEIKKIIEKHKKEKDRLEDMSEEELQEEGYESEGEPEYYCIGLGDVIDDLEKLLNLLNKKDETK